MAARPPPLAAAARLIDSLVTLRPPRNRDVEREKAALLMHERGLPHVLQLDGGILKYFEVTQGATSLTLTAHTIAPSLTQVLNACDGVSATGAWAVVVQLPPERVTSDAPRPLKPSLPGVVAPQMSRMPSLSPSTAVVRKTDGRNCVWPMAPAQEPRRVARVASPVAMICRAALSWLSANSRRRPSAARVAMQRSTSISPWMRPKLLSTAQMAIRISRGTPNFCSMAGKKVRESRKPRPWRTRSSLTVPFTLLDREIQSTASIGIVLGDADSDDATSLLRNADTAMYEAKRGGRNRVSTFGSDDTGWALPAM